MYSHEEILAAICCYAVGKQSRFADFLERNSNQRDALCLLSGGVRQDTWWLLVGPARYCVLGTQQESPTQVRPLDAFGLQLFSPAVSETTFFIQLIRLMLIPRGSVREPNSISTIFCFCFP